MHRIRKTLKGTDTMQVKPQEEPTLILRINDVMIRTGLPKSSVYEKVKKEEITAPIPIGTRRVGWPSFEIDEINKALIAGADTQTIKLLVKQLTDARQNLFSGVVS